MEDGDTEKYHAISAIQDFVFLSRKRGCIRCISLQVYKKKALIKCMLIYSRFIVGRFSFLVQVVEYSIFKQNW